MNITVLQIQPVDSTTSGREALLWRNHLPIWKQCDLRHWEIEIATGTEKKFAKNYILEQQSFRNWMLKNRWSMKWALFISLIIPHSRPSTRTRRLFVFFSVGWLFAGFTLDLLWPGVLKLAIFLKNDPRVSLERSMQQCMSLRYVGTAKQIWRGILPDLRVWADICQLLRLVSLCLHGNRIHSIFLHFFF